MPIYIEKSIYDPKAKNDGFRLLVMQYWPRGVKKQKIDAWYRELGTSKELIKTWNAGKITWAEFKTRYLADLKDEHKQSLLHELAMRAKKRENYVTLRLPRLQPLPSDDSETTDRGGLVTI